MSENLELTNPQLISVVTAYASGKTSGQIIDDLIDEFGIEDTPDSRETLRNQLRSANPNDARFSTTKFGVQFETAREAALEVLRERSRDYFDGVMSSLTESLETIEVIETSLNNLLDTASDNAITSNTEYLNTIKVLAGLQKVKVEGINAFATLVDALTQAIPVPSHSDNGKE